MLLSQAAVEHSKAQERAQKLCCKPATSKAGPLQGLGGADLVTLSSFIPKCCFGTKKINLCLSAVNSSGQGGGGSAQVELHVARAGSTNVVMLM